MIHLVTGYAGYEHIKSEDDGSFNAAFFGDGQFVMESGSMFEASIIDNNTVRLLDGDGLMYGRHFRMERHSYEDVAISTGTAGMNRKDLICVVYSKDAGTGVESTYLQVIKGAETSGTAAAPEYTNGDILNGATFSQFPLYEVNINGVVLKSIKRLFTICPTYRALAEMYAEEFEVAINDLKTSNILDSMEEVNANKKAGMIAGALAVKEGFAAMKQDVNGKASITVETTIVMQDLEANSHSVVNITPPSTSGYKFYPLTIQTNTTFNIAILSYGEKAIRVYNNTDTTRSVTFTITWLGIK